jgi:uncharacterized membrane protein
MKEDCNSVSFYCIERAYSLISNYGRERQEESSVWMGLATHFEVNVCGSV